MINISWNQTTSVYDVRIITPFGSTEFDTVIACIKLIPSLSRNYDAATKLWSISENFLTVLESALKHKGLVVNTFKKPTAPPPFMQGSSLSEQDKYILVFFKSLPYDIAAKVFKLGMIALHPDKNLGDTNAADLAARFSEAWTYLEKHFYRK